MTVKNMVIINCVNELPFHRGTTFRPAYLKVGQLRGILCETPLALLTATMTDNILKALQKHLSLDAEELKHVSCVPDRYHAKLYICCRNVEV